MITIRLEQDPDILAVYKVNEEAFERHNEAEVVDLLRSRDAALLSLVAELDDQIIGHIFFTKVTVETPTGQTFEAVGLAPVAVIPPLQKRGIGGMLIKAGLEACTRAGHALVFLVGHPTYYPRFGFQAASKYGYRWEHEAPEEAFMVCELQPGSLPGPGGVVRFRPEFAAAE